MLAILQILEARHSVVCDLWRPVNAPPTRREQRSFDESEEDALPERSAVVEVSRTHRAAVADIQRAILTSLGSALGTNGATEAALETRALGTTSGFGASQDPFEQAGTTHAAASAWSLSTVAARRSPRPLAKLAERAGGLSRVCGFESLPLER